MNSLDPQISLDLRTTTADLTAPVISRSDVLVVGGGPAGVAAAVTAARSGASVTLLERYSSLGGLASGGMVLVLDDMINGQEITVTGIVSEYVERLQKLGLAIVPPADDRKTSEELWNKWGRYGTFDFHSHTTPKPVCYAAAFDPDGWKRVSNDLVREAGVNLRLHSWFSRPIVDNGVMKGVICETKSGPQAFMADIVIDTTGDIDVASRAGASYVKDSYLTTLVFRLGNVDTNAAEAFEQANPKEARAINRKIKRLLGGAWELWWLKTPIDGVVWCNAPHMTGFDGVDPADMTAAEFAARDRISEAVDYVRANLPGFENCYMLDVASQMGVRQTRLLEGEYVMTKDDVTSRRHFADTVARGRDYYYPYRSLLPKEVDQLLVAGRHYSATPEAQKMSREIPPCMAMGQAVGVAAAIAIETGHHRPRSLPAGNPAGHAPARRGPGRRPVVERHPGPGRGGGGMSTVIEELLAAHGTARRRPRRRRDRTTLNPRHPAAAGRDQDRGLHPGVHGPVLHPAAGRLRRGHHQGGTPGRRGHLPQLVPGQGRPGQPDLPVHQPEQAQHLRGHPHRRGQGRAPPPARRRRRGGQQLPLRRDGTDGLRLRGPQRAEPGHHLGLRHRLRPRGPVLAQGRPGRDRPGLLRRDVAARIGRHEAVDLPHHALRLHHRHAPHAGHPAGAAHPGDRRRRARRWR